MLLFWLFNHYLTYFLLFSLSLFNHMSFLKSDNINNLNRVNDLLYRFFTFWHPLRGSPCFPIREFSGKIWPINHPSPTATSSPHRPKPQNLDEGGGGHSFCIEGSSWQFGCDKILQHEHQPFFLLQLLNMTKLIIIWCVVFWRTLLVCVKYGEGLY